MKNILLILYLIVSSCLKDINIDEYDINKEHSSNEEEKSKKENENLSKGNDLEKENKKLIKAIKNNDTTKVLEALKNGADINHDYKGRTPLIYASYTCLSEAMLKVLLDAGADISKMPIFSNNFMAYNSELFEFLIRERYIKVNKRDANRRTILNNMCYHGAKGSIKLLHYLFKETMMCIFKNKGANFNTHDIDGNTPLMFLVNNNFDSSTKEKYIKKYIKMLIRFGAYINSKNNEGDTALIIAARNGDISSIKVLLKLNANVLTKNNLGEDALISTIATMTGYFEKIIDENMNDMIYYKNTIIHYRDLIKKKERNAKVIIKDLIRLGVDINSTSSNGDTPLILATRFCSPVLVETLLELNANILVKNNLGEDVLIVIIKKLASLPYIHFNYMFNRSVNVLKRLLDLFPPDLIDVALLIKQSTSIRDFQVLKKVLSIIFGNKKLMKIFLYKDEQVNIEKLLFIQNLQIHENLKNKIIMKINNLISSSRESCMLENKAFIVRTLFSYDTFIFRNKGLLIDAFFNIVKLYKLEEENDVKKINELLTNSLFDYYIDKVGNEEGYEDKFLKEIAIIKSKINIFVTNLYNKAEDSNSSRVD